MTRSFHSELLKIRHTRSQVGLLLAGIAYAGISLLPPALLSAEEKAAWDADTLVAAVRGPMWFIAVMGLLFGIVASAGELRHRTLATSSLLNPHRGTLFATKTAAVALSTGAAALVAAIVSGLGAVALFRGAGLEVNAWSGKVWSTAAVGVVVVAIYASAGVGIGFLARHDALAVGLSLVWITVVEGVIPIVLDKPWLGDWLPGGLVNRLLSVASSQPFTVPVPTAVLLLAAITGGLGIAGWASLRFRDVP